MFDEGGIRVRFSKWLCAIGIAFICVVYGAGTALAQGGVLRIPYLEDPKTADCQTQTISYLLPLNCFDRLVECITVGPGESKIVPGLAERWEISDDGRVYTFYLRKGVFFHHGTELTADDVVYTFDRMLDPNTRALNTDILDWVEGARERMDGKAIYTKGLEALDRYTVQITLRGPYAPFLAVMASPQASIYNREFTIKSGNRFGLTPETTSGTGPFVMKEYVLNDHLLLVANEDYYRGRPQVDEILVRITPDPETLRMLFEAGEIDIFDCDYAVSQIPYFTNHPKWKDYVASSPRVGIYYYSINQRIKPFDDVRVRKALQMAIDRKLILDELFYGKGHLENGIMPRGLICHNPDLPVIEYDPEKAKALLAQAGYPDGVEMEIAQVSGARQWLRINEVVQAMLREAGFKARIRQMDEAAFYATRSTGDLPSYVQVWSADFNDPDNFFYTFFAPRNTVARSFNYESQEVFDALEKGRSLSDQGERCELYRKLEQVIVQRDAAWVPLFSLEHVYVLQPRVKNFVAPWNGWSDMSYYGIRLED